MPALCNFQRVIGAIELIDEGDSAHRELAPFGLGQIAQRRVKAARAHEKRAVQQSAAAQLAPGAQRQQVAAAGGCVQHRGRKQSF